MQDPDTKRSILYITGIQMASFDLNGLQDGDDRTVNLAW